jgi:hypothetical protein
MPRAIAVRQKSEESVRECDVTSKVHSNTSAVAVRAEKDVFDFEEEFKGKLEKDIILVSEAEKGLSNALCPFYGTFC